MSNDAERLTKVHLDLPNLGSGEAIWARPLGGNLYEIQNIPFMAYGLNYLDVVYAEETNPNLKPSVLRVARRSGHETIRCTFSKHLSKDVQKPYLDGLAALDVSFERATERYVGIDVHPGADISAVRARLNEFLAAGILDYETCEERVPGSFDDAPKDAESADGPRDRR